MLRTRLRLPLFAALALAAPSHAQTLRPLWPFGPTGLSLVRPPLLEEADRRDKALAYVYISPTRPGQNRVEYWRWDWHTFDFNTDRGGGGVRLYFYEREREAASYDHCGGPERFAQDRPGEGRRDHPVSLRAGRAAHLRRTGAPLRDGDHPGAARQTGIIAPLHDLRSRSFLSESPRSLARAGCK